MTVRKNSWLKQKVEELWPEERLRREYRRGCMWNWCIEQGIPEERMDLMLVDLMIELADELEKRGFEREIIPQILKPDNMRKVFDVAHIGECFLKTHRGELLPTWEGKTTYYE